MTDDRRTGRERRQAWRDETVAAFEALLDDVETLADEIRRTYLDGQAWRSPAAGEITRKLRALVEAYRGDPAPPVPPAR